MTQWEMCRVTSVDWKREGKKGTEWDTKVAIDYYSLTGVISKFPPIEAWGQVLAILGAAGWESITVQHRLVIVGSTAWGGYLSGRLYFKHPSGDTTWNFEGCEVAAYFKRPMQAGRKIDDAL